MATLGSAGAHRAGPNATSGANNVAFRGGLDGVGVTIGAPKVYLVFWGSQWGAPSIDAHGYVTLSGDPAAMAPDLEAFFKGLGTNSDTWSAVMTQYCEGVASGAQTCPTSAAHVGYPTGGALAGVWADGAAPVPGNATNDQLVSESLRAAAHFGNTTQASNRNDQYVVVSPTGAHPDGFLAGGLFCAWHGWSNPSGAGNPPLPVAFTNLPYIPDAGTSCGMNFVNSDATGALDGVTIVAGHEYAETVTDQFPAGG